MITRLFLRRRAAAMFTALITVWCLGCSAFEPLVAALIEAPIGMTCASEGMTAGANGPSLAAMAAMAASSERGVDATATAPATHGYDCGCQSCCGAAPTAYAAGAALVLASGIETPELPSLVSIAREPLVPPPQAAS